MDQDITKEKAKLRSLVISKREKLDSAFKAEYDQWICNELYRFISDKKLSVIHSYIPIRSEINILPLIEKLIAKNITVVSPKTLIAKKLEHFILSDVQKLETGLFGTIYPGGNDFFEEETYDLIIVPGVAFDHSMYRLGYGGGYYDNFLSDHPLAHKIGICYPFQVFDKIPKEPHDAKLDQLLYRPVDG